MKRLSYGSIFLFFFLNANAQNFDSNLEKYSKDFGQEKMYLQYDKSEYVPGETIWFKDYLMKGMYPDNENKTVYLDWIGENNNILLHSVCAVEEASAFGQFEIPSDYAGKYIHVKAYTKWMLNFDTAFLYNHDIKILSIQKPEASKNIIIPELHFFPEGGDAIRGVTNKIAFKANDQFGRPVQIKGVIKNNTGSVIDSLRIIHDGMGYFFIIPQGGQTFSAFWEDETGAAHNTPLPEIKNIGINLRVTIAGSNRNFLISEPSSSNALSKIHILGTMYEQKIFELDETLQNGKAEGTIPTESLPSGILTITVFNEQWQPLAERITYINNEDYLFNPEITVPELGLKKRAKNKIQITLPEGLSSNLSVSITDAKIDNNNSDNIISHLLLTSELRGKINNPAHYFLNNSDSITSQLDLIMLTHGWRRFDWEKVAKGEFPEILYPKDTAYLCLSGKISGATAAQLQTAGDIILMLKQNNSGTQTFTIPVHPDGSFRDPSLILFDTARIFYNLVNPKGLKNISVKFMQGIVPPVSNKVHLNNFYVTNATDTTGSHYQLQLSNARERELMYLKGKVLANIKIKTKTKSHLQELNEKYTSGMFISGNATELDLVDDPLAVTYTDVISYIQGKVPGLYYDNSSHIFLWLRSRSSANTPPLYLDEMSASYDMISQIPVANIAFIKVFRPGFVGGAGSGTSGAIVIYRRHGGDQKVEGKGGMPNSLVSGYTAIRRFYSPDYDSTNTDNDKKDLRSTLYWNPSVITMSGQNKVDLTFFNNDISDSFRIIIEGMSRDGRLAHIEKIVE